MSDLHDAAVEAATSALHAGKPYDPYYEGVTRIALAALANDPRVREGMREALRLELSNWEHYDGMGNSTIDFRTAVEQGADAILRALGGGDG